MLDLFTVFTKGGLVLWQYDGFEGAHKAGRPSTTDTDTTSASAATGTGSLVNALIAQVFFQGKSADSQYTYANQWDVQWTFANELDLIFVVRQRMAQTSYFLSDGRGGSSGRRRRIGWMEHGITRVAILVSHSSMN